MSYILKERISFTQAKKEVFQKTHVLEIFLFDMPQVPVGDSRALRTETEVIGKVGCAHVTKSLVGQPTEKLNLL